MYPYPVLFGVMGIYDILLVTGIVACMFCADRMAILRKFSVKLQKVLIIGFMVAIITGLFGTVFFQAIYNWIETGKFVIDKNTGMTFYGGLIFGVIFFLAVWFGLGAVWCKNDEPKKTIRYACGYGRLLNSFRARLGSSGLSFRRLLPRRAYGQVVWDYPL